MIKRTASISLMLPLLFAWGCRPAPKDTSRVIASIGDVKITEKNFADLVEGLAPNPAQAQDFLTNPAHRESRAQLADQLAMQKAVMAYASQDGLTKDPKIQRQIENAEAGVYFQALVQKRLEGVTPTDEQLKAFYDQKVAALKAQGQDKNVPTYEMVKAQLPNLWRQERSREVAQEVQQDIRTRIPITLADDYKPAAR
jgi:hypothetical protein